MRIGALVARGPAASRLRALRAVDDFFVPQPMQEAATELLGSSAWTRHRSALRRALLARRDALLAALAEHAPQLAAGPVPAGGLHLWRRLPDGLDDLDVARRCELRGLAVGSGTPYHASEPPAPYLRLTYCAEPPDRLARAARILGEVLAC
jgi:DNA-binding transcriptional MocR family regulator